MAPHSMLILNHDNFVDPGRAETRAELREKLQLTHSAEAMKGGPQHDAPLVCSASDVIFSRFTKHKRRVCLREECVGSGWT